MTGLAPQNRPVSHVLHLIDHDQPAAAGTLASLVRALPEAGHRVMVRGASDVKRELQGYGLACQTMPYARPALGRGWTVVAWSARCAAAAVLGWRRPVCYVAFDRPRGWRGGLLRRSGCTALCFSRGLAAELGGVAVEPAFDPRLLGPRSDEGWGRREGDRVVALVSDDPRAADVLAGVLAISIADEADKDRGDGGRWRLLAHPDARNAARGRVLADEAGAPWRLLVDPAMGQPWRVLPRCDAALCFGDATALAGTWAGVADIPAVPLHRNGARQAAAMLREAVRRPSTPPPTACGLESWRAILNTGLTHAAV